MEAGLGCIRSVGLAGSYISGFSNLIMCGNINIDLQDGDFDKQFI